MKAKLQINTLVSEKKFLWPGWRQSVTTWKGAIPDVIIFNYLFTVYVWHNIVQRMHDTCIAKTLPSTAFSRSNRCAKSGCLPVVYQFANSEVHINYANELAPQFRWKPLWTLNFEHENIYAFKVRSK